MLLEGAAQQLRTRHTWERKRMELPASPVKLYFYVLWFVCVCARVLIDVLPAAHAKSVP